MWPICGFPPIFSGGKLGWNATFPKVLWFLRFYSFILFSGELVCGTTAFGGNKMRLHTEVVLIPLHSRRGKKTFSRPPSLKKGGRKSRTISPTAILVIHSFLLPRRKRGQYAKKQKAEKQKGKEGFFPPRFFFPFLFLALHFCRCWSITIWQSLELHGGRGEKVGDHCPWPPLKRKGRNTDLICTSVGTFSRFGS